MKSTRPHSSYSKLGERVPTERKRPADMRDGRHERVLTAGIGLLLGLQTFAMTMLNPFVNLYGMTLIGGTALLCSMALAVFGLTNAALQSVLRELRGDAELGRHRFRLRTDLRRVRADVAEAFSDVLDIPPRHVYLRFSDIPVWSVGDMLVDRRMFA